MGRKATGASERAIVLGYRIVVGIDIEKVGTFGISRFSEF